MSHYHFIPEGFKTLSPYFCVEDAKGFIAFLEKAFDGEIVYLHKGENDIIMYARVKIGNSLLELSEAKPPTYPGKQFACQLFVADCDEVYKRALEAGAGSIGEPSDMPYGLRAGYITDAWGNQWYISTQIKNRYSPEFWEKLENHS